MSKEYDLAQIRAFLLKHVSLPDLLALKFEHKFKKLKFEEPKNPTYFDVTDKIIPFVERNMLEEELLKWMAKTNPEVFKQKKDALILKPSNTEPKTVSQAQNHNRYFHRPVQTKFELKATVPSDINPLDLSGLDEFLHTDNWRSADEETHKILLQIAGRGKEAWLRQEDIKMIPTHSLKEIDRVWAKRSHGHFGYSQQLQIWSKLIKNKPTNRVHIENFAHKVGWLTKCRIWLPTYEKMTFSLDAPPGHLPSWRFPGFYKQDERYFQLWQNSFHSLIKFHTYLK